MTFWSGRERLITLAALIPPATAPIMTTGFTTLDLLGETMLG
jgi:hypothetical protein